MHAGLPMSSAALPDAFSSLNLHLLGRILRDAATRFLERRSLTAAAAVAFYAAFALAPTLVIVLALASTFFGHEAAQGELYAQFAAVMGAETARALQEMVKNAWSAGGGGAKAAISAIAVAVGASAIFAQLKESLNETLGGERTGSAAATSGARSSPQWYAPVKIRLAAFGATVGVGFLFVVFLLADAAMLAALNWFWPGGQESQVAALIVSQIVSTAFLAALFAWLLRILPDVRMSGKSIVMGGIFGAAFFNVGKHLFGLYLSKAGTAGAFGAAGSLAVLLMWLYFSALVFLFAAQIAHAADGAIGRRRPIGA